MIAERFVDTLPVYAKRRPKPLMLREFFELGKQHERHEETLLHAAQYLHTELPVRCARLIAATNTLPVALGRTQQVREIVAGYGATFSDLLAFPHPRSLDEEIAFSALISSIRERHRAVVETMARGLAEARRSHAEHPLPEEGIHAMLDGFYQAKLSVCMLLNQYLAMHRERPGWVGLMCGQTSPAQIIDAVGARAAELCRIHYGDAPALVVEADPALRLLQVPSHIDHILHELTKNAMRATVERAQRLGLTKLPPVRARVAAGAEDVTIVLSDEGGGMRRDVVARVFEYLYTTAPQAEERALPEQDIDPMAGLGYGLPISRVYARYFGGDLRLESADGFGTWCFVHVSRLPEARETFPW